MAARPIHPTSDPDVDSDTDPASPLVLSTDLTQCLANEETSLKIFDKPVESLNVVDVYNIASSVGLEFERLTDAFGGIVFSGVMPKIIRILEMLEALVGKREKEADCVAALTDAVKKLQADSKLKDEKQLEEIEVIESAWKDETRNLLETVATLEEDNQKLTALLTENLKEDSSSDMALPNQQASVIAKLQQQIIEQRDEVRSKNARLEEQANELDALQSQIQRLSNLNVDVRNKLYILENQAKTLIDEKSELEAKLDQRGQAQTELQLKSIKSDKLSTSNELVTNENRHDIQPEQMATLDPLLANKLVIDLNDPNRPRYTLQELQEVLTDRNQLKARCFLLEEELLYHRGEDTWEELDDHEIRQSKIHAHRQPQPPLAPESGVRKFFHFLTGDSAWRNKTASPSKKPPPAAHEIFEGESVNKKLISTDEIRELVPDARMLNDLTAIVDGSEQVAAAEMSVVSPVVEREDFSP